MKAEKRQEVKQQQAGRGPRMPGEDPDIAGIVPGPQRRPDDELLGELEIELAEEEIPEV